MKKLLLTLSVFVSFGAMQSQVLTSESFNTIGNPAVYPTGWTITNQSVPIGTTLWFQGGGGTTFAGFSGGQTGYIGANFNATTGNNTISTWLMSPAIEVQNGDVVSFYTRKTTNPPTPTTSNTFPDRLEFRYSTNGAFSAEPAGGNTALGDFTNLALSVNPTLALIGYPDTWTQYSYTVSGLTGVTSVRYAFRYWVTSGGPSGANSDYIGIDDFKVERSLSADQFFTQNFAVYPNPVSDVINVSSKNNATVSGFELTDLNGRIVKQATGIVSQINITDLTSGVYFLKVSSELGAGTTKIVKQ